VSAKRRHVRDGDRLDDDDTIVIRGGRLDPAVLRIDAERYHTIYGEYGISVFAARGATIDELAQAVPLVRFETLTSSESAIYGPPGSGSIRPAGTRSTSRSRSTTSNEGSTRSRREHLNWINPYHEL